MKKIYIPTSNLNINNILSTESISPKIFYKKRNFGGKRFRTIKANPYENNILAFSKIPFFNLSKEIANEFVFNIEIPISYFDKCEKILKEDIEIYSSSKTIYLDWDHCSIIVDSQEEKNQLRIATNSSIESKHSKFVIEKVQFLQESSYPTFSWNKNYLEGIRDVEITDSSFVNYDKKINKLRGFLYGYICGLLSEKPKDLIIVKQLIQEFINVNSSVMNNLSGQINKTRKLSNSRSHKNQNQDITRLDQIANELSKIITSKFSADGSDLIQWFSIDDEFLENYYKSCHRISNESIVTILIDYNSNQLKKLPAIMSKKRDALIRSTTKKLYDELELNTDIFINVVEEFLGKSELSESKKKKITDLPFKINKEFQITDINVPNIEANSLYVYKVIINNLISHLDISSHDDFVGVRQKIIGEVGNYLKENLSNFSDSKEHTYLGLMWKSIKNPESGFKINDVNDVVLKTLACFMKKSTDLDKLKDLIHKYKLDSLSLVYGIWGATYGYANLYKTILEPLIHHSKALSVLKEYDEKLLRMNVSQSLPKAGSFQNNYQKSSNSNSQNIESNDSKSKITYGLIDFIDHSKKIHNEAHMELIRRCIISVKFLDDLSEFELQEKLTHLKECFISENKKYPIFFGPKKIEFTLKLIKNYLVSESKKI
jgi:hypothetical protein